MSSIDQVPVRVCKSGLDPVGYRIAVSGDLKKNHELTVSLAGSLRLHMHLIACWASFSARLTFPYDPSSPCFKMEGLG